MIIGMASKLKLRIHLSKPMRHYRFLDPRGPFNCMMVAMILCVVKTDLEVDSETDANGIRLGCNEKPCYHMHASGRNRPCGIRFIVLNTVRWTLVNPIPLLPFFRQCGYHTSIPTLLVFALMLPAYIVTIAIRDGPVYAPNMLVIAELFFPTAPHGVASY